MATRNRAIVAAVRPGERPHPAERGPRQADALEARWRPSGAACVDPSACGQATELRRRRSKPDRARTCPYHARAWSRRSLLAALAVASSRRRAARAAASSRSGPIQPADAGDRRRRPRPTDPTGDQRADRQHASVPVTTDADEPPTLEWQRVRRAASRRPSSRCRSTTTTPTGRRSSCSSPAASPTTRRTRSARCSSTRAAPASAAPSSRPAPSSVYDERAARALRHHRLGPARHRATASRRSTASTTTTSTSPATDITPDDDAEHQEIVDLAEDFADRCVENNADILRVRRHEQQRPRHGLDPPGARRGQDQLLRVQLRQRARRDLGDAVPRHRARRRARRGGRPDRRPAARAACSRPRGFEAALDHVPRRSAAPTSECAFHNGGDAEGAFDALMARARRGPDPERGRPAGRQPRRRPPGGRRGDVLRRQCWEQLSEALAAAQDGDGSGLLALYDSVLPAPARRHVAELPRGVPGDPLHGPGRAPDRRGGRRHRRSFIEVAPRFSPGTTGEYFCTFFPPSVEPACGHHRRRRRADRRDRHDRRSGDAARQHPGDGRQRSRTVASSSSPPTSTPATASTTASTTSSTATSSTSRRRRPRRAADQRVKLGARFSVNAVTASACSGEAQHSRR